MEMYMKYTGMTMENFKEQFRPQAESQVKLQLALEKIVEVEGITATDEEVDAEYARLAEMYKVEADKVRAAISVDMVKHDLTVNKAVALVKENAKITEKAEGEEAEEKKPAKKTAKKTTKKAEEPAEAPAEGEEKPKKTTTRKTTKKAEEKPADAE